jgi:hypothetical protein
VRRNRFSASDAKAASRRDLPLAADLARQVGMVRTWSNVQIIRLAIESEAEDSNVSLAQAAALIAVAASEQSHLPQYSCATSWEEREFHRNNAIDRFWFEDARWRTKVSYWNLLERLKAEAK